MASPYVALYPSDFLADIGHLGNTELGIYWRLLLVYYRDGRPLPFDTDRLRRLAMTFSPEECRALEQVVAEFFVLSTEPDGSRVWRHKRADTEIERATKYIDAKRSGAEKARAKLAEKRANPLISEQTSTLGSELIPRGEPEPEPEPTLNKQPTVVVETRCVSPKPERIKTLTVKDLVAEGVDEKHAADWLKVRREKKAPLTLTAWEGVKREAHIAGMSPAQAVQTSAENSWQGFKASWLEKTARTTPESFRERDARLAAERVSEATGGLSVARREAPKPLPFEEGFVVEVQDAKRIA